MTRDEVHAAIAHLMTMAGSLAAEDGDSAKVTGQAQGIAESARTLEAALEKSEANTVPASRPLRIEVRLRRDVAQGYGIDFGSGWACAPRPFVEAGPGLWRGLALRSEDGDYLITVEQVAP